MKKALLSVVAVVLVISFSISFAFADTVTNNRDSAVSIYFPWFSGVGSAGSTVTNTGTVTTSDVTSSGFTFTNIFDSYRTNPNNYGVTVTGGSSWTISGTPSGNFYPYVLAAPMSGVVGHTYYFDSFVTGNGFDGIYTGNFSKDGSSLSYSNMVKSGILTCTNSSETAWATLLYANTPYDFSVKFVLIDLTVAGLDNLSFDEVKSLITNYFGSYQHFTGSISNSFSSFSLVPKTGIAFGVSRTSYDDNTLSNMSLTLDISTIEEMVLDITGGDTFEFEDITQESGGNWTISGKLDGSSYQVKGISGFGTTQVYEGAITAYNFQLAGPLYSTSSAYGAYTVDPDLTFSGVTINRGNTSSSTTGDGSTTYDLDGTGSSEGTSTGSVTFNRIVTTNERTYFYNNNYVNLGTYDFNFNVIFPSDDTFNSFSGLFMGSFNTSWGEVPVRVQSQLVSSNIDTRIKVYKLTFDVPFSGTYTKFNIKFVGDNNFTTIRVDSSVINPNAYVNGLIPTSTSGLALYLNGLFDSLWGKVRSLFFDNDQVAEQAITSSGGQELASTSQSVSEGTETIHNFETETFDNVETIQNDIDWTVPTDFGSSNDPTSEIGFIGSIFMGIYNALPGSMTTVIVIPLMLGLVMLIIGRGSSALGRIASVPPTRKKR